MNVKKLLLVIAIGSITLISCQNLPELHNNGIIATKDFDNISIDNIKINDVYVGSNSNNDKSVRYSINQLEYNKYFPAEMEKVEVGISPNGLPCLYVKFVIKNSTSNTTGEKYNERFEDFAHGGTSSNMLRLSEINVKNPYEQNESLQIQQGGDLTIQKVYALPLNFTKNTTNDFVIDKWNFNHMEIIVSNVDLTGHLNKWKIKINIQS